jgi:hypothetical protein
MLKVIMKFQFFFFCIIAFGTCIDPYYPHLDKYQSVLVVEGLVTDEKVPYKVRLSRTFQSIDSMPEIINDAIIYIADETGNMTSFEYSDNGIYKTDSAFFYGEPGKTYTLHIETRDGNKYQSQPCVMLPASNIDSVYLSREEEIDNIQGKFRTGIMIYLDIEENNEDGKYFRWEYEETWKFRSPYPKRFDYINGSLIKLDSFREYCWKSNKSGEILILSVLPGQEYSSKNVPITFIPSDESDRLTVRYSILIKQYSISQKEFDFWYNLKQVSERGGNIFDTQPFPVISNIFNTDNPEEIVLGYFEVSSVKERRIFIIPEDLKELDLPRFNYSCLKFVVSPSDYNPPMSFDEIYQGFMAHGGIVFVETIYDKESKESKLVFVQKECSDCSIVGTITKPEFWDDLP